MDMRRCCHTVAVLVAAVLTHHGAAEWSEPAFHCGLPSSLPAEVRRNVTVDGVSMPFGIRLFDWPSALIAGKIIAIVAQEVLGLHTVVLEAKSSCVQVLGMIAGCANDFRSTCDLRPASTSHAAIETWEAEVGAYRAPLAAFLGDRMPMDLGSLGYGGYEAVFLPTSVYDAAQAQGLHLEYYSSYNSSWHSPSRFFDRYSDISTEGLLPCSETRFHTKSVAQGHLDLTGDTGGVEEVNGTLVCRCLGGPSGRWWIAPACRHDPNTCVPYIDSGDGWWIDALMQRAVAYNMPLAITVGTWEKYTRAPKEHRVLFYWWNHDPTFLGLKPRPVLFPSHNFEQWASGNKITESKVLPLRNWIHSELGREELLLRKTIKNMRITDSQIKGLLAQTLGNRSDWEIACDWIKAEENTWRSWLPNMTQCELGAGLLGRTGHHVQNRSQAVSCGRCPPSTSSQPLRDADGETRICVACPLGYFQPNQGQLACSPCEAGTYGDHEGHAICHTCEAGRASAEAGSSSCEECRPGSFQPIPGMSSCEACPGGSFVAAAGATACGRCRPGEFSGANSTACQECPAGRVSDASSSSECSACEPGRFAEAAGLSACSACAIGSFAEAVGSTACEPCAGGAPRWTTMRRLQVGENASAWVRTDAAANASACGCDEGARPDGDGGCVGCGAGVECAGMGEVRVLPGFASAVELSVFRCRIEGRCPGGPPGASCAPGRFGTACATCPAGTWSRPDQSCAPCDTSSFLPFCLICGATALGCFLLYCVFEVADLSRPGGLVLLAGASGGLLMAMTQQLSVISLLDASHAEPLRSFIVWVATASSNAQEALRVHCAIGASPVSDFIVAVCFILGRFAFMLPVHALFVGTYHRWDFRGRLPTLISCVGTLALLYYTPITVLVLKPLNCAPNPNGKLTVVGYDGVICWSPEDTRHSRMVVVSLAASSVPVLIFAVVSFLVRRLPRAMRDQDVEFFRSYGILFARFSPRAHWYVLVLLSRSLIFALVPLLPRVSEQIYILQAVLVASFVAVVTLRPWRSQLLNMLDVLSGVAMFQFIVTTAITVDRARLDEESIGWFCVTSMLVVLALVPLFLAHVALKRLGGLPRRFQFFICNDGAESGSFARWLKMDLLRRPGVTREVFLSADTWEPVSQLVMIVASDVDTLVVLGTRLLMQRPECVAALATARRNRVAAVLIALPSFQRLSGAAVDEYVDGTSMSAETHGLAADGVLAGEVREAFRELCRRTPVTLPQRVDAAAMCRVIDTLVGCPRSAAIAPMPGSAGEVRVAIIADGSCFEAAAAAHVLELMLTPAVVQTFGGLPRVLAKHKDIPVGVVKAVVVLTPGCLSAADFLMQLLSASEHNLHLIPVAGHEFCIPTRDEISDTVRRLQCFEQSAEVILKTVLEMFQDIAIAFNTKRSASALLEVGRDAILARLIAKAPEIDDATRAMRPCLSGAPRFVGRALAAGAW